MPLRRLCSIFNRRMAGPVRDEVSSYEADGGSVHVLGWAEDGRCGDMTSCCPLTSVPLPSRVIFPQTRHYRRSGLTLGLKLLRLRCVPRSLGTDGVKWRAGRWPFPQERQGAASLHLF